ncbi:hypothetical protein [Methanoculleus sp.]|uniref:hypothetical protein n=1 Tax=Methanoculleus sp. TaxID=90427 RepID=UPI002FCC99AF
MKPYGMPARSPRARLFLLVAFFAFFIMPCSVSGATPPLLPSLTLSVSNDTLSGNEDLAISVTWSRDASFYHPPGSVDVLFYSAGSPVAGYTIPGDDRAAADDNTRHFRGTVAASELPEGRLLLVATDPVSGAEARAPVNVTEPGRDFSGTRPAGSTDTAFLQVAVVLLVALGAGLGLLVRRP